MAQHDVETALVLAQHPIEAAFGELIEAAVFVSFSPRKKREAIIGVNVRATKADTAMHIVVVTANSRNSRPMMRRAEAVG